MDRAGAQEVLLPIAQPLELWERTGRDRSYGPLMFKLEDRKGTGFALSPTAEELITTTVAGEYTSYRDLPVNLYQINWKYRDELRPRFGLLRAAGVPDEGRLLLRPRSRRAPGRVRRDVRRLRPGVHPLRAHVPRRRRRSRARSAATRARSSWRSPRSARTRSSGARAATTRRTPRPRRVSPTPEATRRPTTPGRAPKVHTPDLPGIDEVAKHLGTSPDLLLKCDRVRRRRRARPRARPRRPRGQRVRARARASRPHGPPLRRRRLRRAPGAAEGLHRARLRRRDGRARRLLGPSAARLGHRRQRDRPPHDRHACSAATSRPPHWDEIVVVEPGDPCPSCGAALRIDRGIEVGHVFQLGTKYTEALGAHYTDDAGEQHPMVMGCYGIGISRIVAAVAEEHHDEHGLAWPAALAPYDVHLVALGDVAPGGRLALLGAAVGRVRGALRRPRRAPGREVRRRRSPRRAGAARRRRQGPRPRRRRAQGPRHRRARRARRSTPSSPRSARA